MKNQLNYNHKEKYIIKTKSHMDPKECCKPLVYSFAKIVEMKCTMKAQAIPSVQPLKMTEKLQDIDKKPLIPNL